MAYRGKWTYLAPPHSYARPLVRGLRSIGFRVVESKPPNTVNIVYAKGSMHGLIPLASLSRLRLCRGPMVYTLGETMSVIIVSMDRMGIEECRSIAVTGESRTSIMYLRLISREMGLNTRIIQYPPVEPRKLLERGDCALVIGDEALRARVRYNIVGDLGLLARNILGITPVYAVTASRWRCSKTLTRYKPISHPQDPTLTSRRTGIPLHEAEEYHRLIKLDYNRMVLEDTLEKLQRIMDRL